MTPASRTPRGPSTDGPERRDGAREIPRGGVRDGRDMRWEAHRARRRRQLVEAALRAIRHRGAGVGMDEIAAEGATSKTVLYRHLGDRAGLHRAVVAAVDETILADLAEAAAAGGDVVERISAMVRSYLALVERDPEIYRFVVNRPLESGEAGEAGDPVHEITDRISEQLAATLHEHLVAAGRADEADVLSLVWGQGIVGLVRSVSDRWLTARANGTGALTVDEVTSAVVALIDPALATTDHP
ncbi:TetR/AcrR family transcriptional regulator [Ornithinimicrobium avium]|uniref:TetR/AcrR family transcriptional regulator n=1 Tax=Ornithinimicrobium avium TaxID=2283195 RepID=A0A345NR68_9MICO|nr:TetR family transcriptional regulator [Ornithinimicrobium avium]AXH97526.1 TetR/AcrR family transcriptional regulator [Ornithinimicrobium avium]